MTLFRMLLSGVNTVLGYLKETSFVRTKLQALWEGGALSFLYGV